MSAPSDQLGRPLGSLRISVTDRCNLRCQYCMPEESYAWLPREDLLSFEEIARLADAFIAVGVDRIRITGGEPLMRRELPALVRMLAARPGIRDLALTTNGQLLGDQAAALKDAGLHRLTVSLDTLRPERFLALTRRPAHRLVLDGIEAARRAGFEGLKLDSVIMRGVNDDELGALIGYGREVGAEVRFIEYMDVGGATRWSADKVFSRQQMLDALTAEYGPIVTVAERGPEPAQRFRLGDGTVFGIISSTTQPFCRSCDRSRLTADGMWLLCLYAARGLDLRTALRKGATDAELTAMLHDGWTRRSDRGAEQRLELADRGALASAGELKGNPHLEMHKRGG